MEIYIYIYICMYVYVYVYVYVYNSLCYRPPRSVNFGNEYSETDSFFVKNGHKE